MCALIMAFGRLFGIYVIPTAWTERLRTRFIGQSWLLASVFPLDLLQCMSVMSHDLNAEHGFETFEMSFVNCSIGPSPKISLDHGVELLRTCEATFQKWSHRRGLEVSITW